MYSNTQHWQGVGQKSLIKIKQASEADSISHNKSTSIHKLKVWKKIFDESNLLFVISPVSG